MNRQPIRVLIIAAAGRLCRSLQAVIASQPQVSAVITACDEAAVCQQLAATSIDLVLLDGDLPSDHQRRILRDLTQQPAPIATILLGGAEPARHRAQRAGITAWLPSGCSTEQLFRQIDSACAAHRNPRAEATNRHSPATPAPMTALSAPLVASAAQPAQTIDGKELRMTASTNSALVSALRDFFMAGNRTELRTAYLALAQVAPQPAPRYPKWDELEFAFNRLFVGPKALFAPPYASVYLEPEPQVMGRTTLKIREFYRLLTLATPARHPLPDDHLGLELDAYYQLQIAATKVNSPELLVLLSALRDHLRQWVPLFVSRVHCAEGTPPALLFVVDQLTQWLAAETPISLSSPLSNQIAMKGVAL